MEHSIEVTYERRIIRRALNLFMVQRLGWPTLAFIVAFGIFLVIEILSGSQSRWLTAELAIWAIVVGLLIAVYLARMQAAEGFFQKSGDCKVQFVFSDSGVRTISDIGTSELTWKVFDGLLKSPDLWLLTYAKSGYMTIPTTHLSEEVKRLIESKISKEAV